MAFSYDLAIRVIQKKELWRTHAVDQEIVKKNFHQQD
jgi:hypothetical protein